MTRNRTKHQKSVFSGRKEENRKYHYLLTCRLLKAHLFSLEYLFALTRLWQVQCSLGLVWLKYSIIHRILSRLEDLCIILAFIYQRLQSMVCLGHSYLYGILFYIKVRWFTWVSEDLDSTCWVFILFHSHSYKTHNDVEILLCY